MIHTACTQATHDQNVAALVRFEHGMGAARAAYFRSHKTERLRRLYVAAQKKRLAKLKTAAACTVTPAVSVIAATDVSSDDAAAVRTAAAAAPAYYESLGAPAFATKIYVFGSRETTEAGYMKVTGASRAQSDELWAQSTAVGGETGVFVNAGATSWRASPATTREEIVSHELFHVVQSILDAKAWDAPGGRGAVWLLEGSAEYMGFGAVISTGALGASDVDATQAYAATFANEPLPRYEDEGSYSLTALYPLGYVAVERLVRDHGIAALFTYFRDLGASPSWQAAFASAFGETADAFYARFSAQ